jgi:hypothetical protein
MSTKSTRRSSAAGTEAAKSVYAQVDTRDGHRCRHCRRYVGSMRHQHHIVYRSKSGTETTENLVTLCSQCHDLVHRKRLWIIGANANLGLTFVDDPP